MSWRASSPARRNWSAASARAYPYLGGKLSPFDAWLLVRGLRTLPIRMKAHEASALDIARRLQALDSVDKVFHPALANRLPPGLTGTSGLFSFTFREGVDIRTFADHLNLFKLGVSWGGHESLIVPRRGGSSAKSSTQFRACLRHRCAVHSSPYRPGGTEALWRDLEAAMAAATEN